MHIYDGVDVASNTTIVPSDLLAVAHTAYTVASGTTSDPHVSIQGYALGWVRYSLLGHDVSSGPAPPLSVRSPSST